MKFNWKKPHQVQLMGRKLITITDPKHLVSEQFRTIRTNLLFSMPDAQLKTILITSATPGEGKSTSAANLAVVFAQGGKRVLLIDADLRRPTLHHTFRIANTKGLSSVLSNQSKWQNAIQELPIYQLHLLSCGPFAPNPAELLSSKNMSLLLKEVREHFDFVIIDAPPILAVSDAQILASICDGVLLIASAGAVQQKELLKAKESLQRVQANILGIVLTNYTISKKESAYQHYYSKNEQS